MHKRSTEKQGEDFIKFLGTAGARFVVSRQLRASGGLWLSVGGEKILIDPGPGSLVRCLSSRPRLDPFTLNGVILTHRHLDHANDINVIIEAMTDGGRKKKGFLYAPRDVFAPPDPVVQVYARAFLETIDYLEEGKSIVHPAFTLNTPVRHCHPVETYGLRFSLPYGNLSLIADTRYFPGLPDYYRGSDILIINVVMFHEYVDARIFHLHFKKAAEIIESIRPKVAVLTHFGTTMLQQKPYLLARDLEQKLGLQVIAAGDGMTLELKKFVNSESSGGIA